jgi:hypothetical protein
MLPRPGHGSIQGRLNEFSPYVKKGIDKSIEL